MATFRDFFFFYAHPEAAQMDLTASTTSSVPTLMLYEPQKLGTLPSRPSTIELHSTASRCGQYPQPFSTLPFTSRATPISLETSITHSSQLPSKCVKEPSTTFGMDATHPTYSPSPPHRLLTASLGALASSTPLQTPSTSNSTSTPPTSTTPSPAAPPPTL